MIIYCITNKVNGKQYVGQTVRTLEERYKEHIRNKTSYLGTAIRKYGRENFTAEVIDSSLLIDDLNEKEIYWTKKLKTKIPHGYNLVDGGDNTLGYNHTLEARMKMSMTKKSLGSMVGAKNHFYGKIHTKETREKMSAAWKTGRRVMTPELKEKLKESHHTRKVMNVTTGEVFNSIKEAGEVHGVKATHITRVCRGRRKSTGGFEWKYVSEETS